MSLTAVCYGSPKLDPSTDQLFGPYDSLNEVAVRAVQVSYGLSNHFEFGGLLVEDTATHKFYYTTPHTDLGIDHVMVPDHRVYFPGHPTYKVVSEWHTHPCFPFSHMPTYFSPQDVQNYLMYHQVGYMGNFCNAKVQKFDPNDPTFLSQLDTDELLGLPIVNPDTVYEGEVVGNISLNTNGPDVQESYLGAIQASEKHDKDKMN